MPTQHPFLEVTEIDTDIETYLRQIGEVTYLFPEHDSGCQSFRTVVVNQRWFVKYGNTSQSVRWLKQAVRFHDTVQHEALPQLHNAFTTPNGFTLVYDWVNGEGLRPERALDVGKLHPRDKFCTLPADEIIATLSVIYDVYVTYRKKRVHC